MSAKPKLNLNIFNKDIRKVYLMLKCAGNKIEAGVLKEEARY
jgi:hypothetical protein